MNSAPPSTPTRRDSRVVGMYSPLTSYDYSITTEGTPEKAEDSPATGQSNEDHMSRMLVGRSRSTPAKSPAATLSANPSKYLQRVRENKSLMERYKVLNEQHYHAKNNGEIMQDDGKGGMVQWLYPLVADEHGQHYPVSPNDLEEFCAEFDIRLPYCWEGKEAEIFKPTNPMSSAFQLPSLRCASRADGGNGCSYMVVLPWVVAAPTLQGGLYEAKVEGKPRGIIHIAVGSGATESQDVLSRDGTPDAPVHTSPVKTEASDVYPESPTPGIKQEDSLMEEYTLPMPPSTQPASRALKSPSKPSIMIDFTQMEESEDEVAAALDVYTGKRKRMEPGFGTIARKRKTILNPDVAGPSKPKKYVDRGKVKTPMIPTEFEQCVDQLFDLVTASGMDLDVFEAFKKRLDVCYPCNRVYYLQSFESHVCPRKTVD
ncbi:hypothetical protein PQX77_003037 [Marasmius sp. AFHP31]|nr:hypothetical protein PQX77_003037 [Marasmius sp. AFHP31]